MEAWNGNSYLVERMGRPPITVEHLLVGVVGRIAARQVVRSFIGDQDGMYAQNLLFMAVGAALSAAHRRRVGDRAGGGQCVVASDQAPVRRRCSFAKMVPLSAEARRRFEQLRQFLHTAKDGLDGREREWWSKVQANVLRLAGTLCFLDWAIKRRIARPEPQVVDEASCRRPHAWSVSISGHTAVLHLRQIGLSERHVNLRRTLRWIKATGKTEVSIKDIRRDALAGSLDADADARPAR